MNLKPKMILRLFDQLSRIESTNESVERALANARAKLAGLAAEPARPLPSKRNYSFLRGKRMFPKVAALVLACAAVVAIFVVFSSPGGNGQFAFAQVIEKVQQTRSLIFKSKIEVPDSHAKGEMHHIAMRLILLPDGRIRSEDADGYTIQDPKAHKMMRVRKENKTFEIMEGCGQPFSGNEKLNLYEMIRNIRKEAVEHLPDEAIDGRKAMVFRVEMKDYPVVWKKPTWKAWIDPKTELPIRLEFGAEDENGKKINDAFYDIEFDRPFDPSLFDFTPPQGYSVQTSGTTNFPDLPDKPELRAPEIIPGVGLGSIRFGMSREKIESLLGKPDGYEANQTSLLYYSRGFVLEVSHRSGLKTINCISQMSSMNRVRDFAGKTKEGIGIGSSLQDVKKVFGKPDWDEFHDAFNKRPVYTKYGLEIQFVQDKVIAISMSEVRSQAKKPSNEKNSPEKKESKTLSRPMRINVVGPDGRPMAGAKIHAGIWYEDKTAKKNQKYVSDAQGQTIIELPKNFDIFRLFTSCDGYVPLFTHWEELDENPPDTFTITLAKGTRIGGFVKNDDGQPIVGAKVEVSMAYDRAAIQKRTCIEHWLAEGDDARTTDAEGRWTLNNVPEGDVKLSLKISHPKYLGDKDWGGLQKEQKVMLEELRRQNGTIILHQKNNNSLDKVGVGQARPATLFGFPATIRRYC